MVSECFTLIDHSNAFELRLKQLKYAKIMK